MLLSYQISGILQRFMIIVLPKTPFDMKIAEVTEIRQEETDPDGCRGNNTDCILLACTFGIIVLCLTCRSLRGNPTVKGWVCLFIIKRTHTSGIERRRI